jgi:hypothetical protein
MSLFIQIVPPSIPPPPPPGLSIDMYSYVLLFLAVCYGVSKLYKKDVSATN